jgi:hypothetical protein
MKRWIPNPIEQCEEHGADVEIFTDAEQTIPGGACAYDGDECRCTSSGWFGHSRLEAQTPGELQRQLAADMGRPERAMRGKARRSMPMREVC